MAREQLERIIQALRAGPALKDQTLEQRRLGYEAAAAKDPTPADINVESVDADGVSAEWITAPGASDDATILWLHGGGYISGSLSTHRTMVSRISRASGARALAIDYRLAPEHPFPAAVEDALAAYHWLLSEGVDPARLIIGGDSAGGGLTIATLVSLRDAGDRLPRAAICVSPWVDLECVGKSMTTKAEIDPLVEVDDTLRLAEAYRGEASPRNPLVSPIHADLSDLPQMLVQVGTSEALLDDSTRLASRAKAHGVDVTLEEWDEMIHVWHFYAGMLPEGHQAIDRIGEFVREHVPVAAAS